MSHRIDWAHPELIFNPILNATIFKAKHGWPMNECVTHSWHKMPDGSIYLLLRLEETYNSKYYHTNPKSTLQYGPSTTMSFCSYMPFKKCYCLIGI